MSVLLVEFPFRESRRLVSRHHLLLSCECPVCRSRNAFCVCCVVQRAKSRLDLASSSFAVLGFALSLTDDVAVWARVLSAGEISQLAGGSTALFPSCARSFLRSCSFTVFFGGNCLLFQCACFQIVCGLVGFSPLCAGACNGFSNTCDFNTGKISAFFRCVDGGFGLVPMMLSSLV